MTTSQKTENRRSVFNSFLAAAACVVCAAVASGCSESVFQQYSALGDWGKAATEPTVLSADPQRDTAAYQSASRDLSAADWQVLEQIAPRPIWDRISDARKKIKGDEAAEEPTTQPTKPAPAATTASTKPPSTQPARVLPDVRTTELPGGKIRMFCRLQNYGGPSISSSLNGGTSRRKITATKTDLKPVISIVSAHLGEGGTVSALPSENSLVIICTKQMKASVLDLLSDIDTPRRQVEISARIFEVRQDFDFQLGARAVLEHMDSNETQSLASTFNTSAFLDFLAAQPGGPAFQGGLLTLTRAFQAAGVRLEATFEALVDTGMVREIAAPRMTVSAGETAYMLAGQELPIQSAKISNNSFEATTTYKPVGVQLYITPRAIGADSVKMHVLTIVSSTSGFAPLPTLSGIQDAQLIINPILDSREAETSVTVRDGETLVIGGMRMVRTITRENKVPALGDIPFIEWLFKSHRSQRQLTDLYFFVTPHIIA